MNTRTFISIVGYPGVGKGYVMSKYLAGSSKYHHISYGDTMRDCDNLIIKELRHAAIVERHSEAFRKLEELFVVNLLPIILSKIDEDKIIILDNFPVHADAYQIFTQHYQLLLLIRVNVTSTDFLVERMLGRARDDSNDTDHAMKRIETYERIVLPNLLKMGKLYDARSKELVLEINAQDDLVAMLSSILDMVCHVHKNYEIDCTTRKTDLFICDDVKMWLHHVKQYRYPESFINTISGTVAKNLQIPSQIFNTTHQTFYFLENPRYVQSKTYRRFIAWPYIDLKKPQMNDVDIHTKKESSFERGEHNLPVNVVDLIQFSVPDLRKWITSLSELAAAGKNHVAKLLNVLPSEIDCFLHYPGASYYSVIHIHFTYRFDCAYDRVHPIERVIANLEDVCNGRMSSKNLLTKDYGMYTTSFDDLYSFYMCLRTQCMTNFV